MTMNRTEPPENPLRETINYMHSVLDPLMAAYETAYKQIAIENAHNFTSMKKWRDAGMLSNEFKEAVQKELQRQGKGNTKTYTQVDFLLTLMTEDVVNAWMNDATEELNGLVSRSKGYEDKIKKIDKKLQDMKKDCEELSACVNSPVVEMDNQAKIAIAMYKNLTEIAKGVGADGNMAAKEGAYIVWAYLTKAMPSLAIEADRKDPAQQRNVSGSATWERSA